MNALAEVICGLGSKSGGATAVDWAGIGESPPSSGSEALVDNGAAADDESEVLLRRRPCVRGVRASRRGRAAALARAAPGAVPASERLAFRCDMLQKRVVGVGGKEDWVTISCEHDEDDFEVLKATACSLDDFRKDMKVILWSPAATSPSNGVESLVRFGKVESGGAFRALDGYAQPGGAPVERFRGA